MNRRTLETSMEILKHHSKVKTSNALFKRAEQRKNEVSYTMLGGSEMSNGFDEETIKMRCWKVQMPYYFPIAATKSQFR